MVLPINLANMEYKNLHRSRVICTIFQCATLFQESLESNVMPEGSWEPSYLSEIETISTCLIYSDYDNLPTNHL